MNEIILKKWIDEIMCTRAYLRGSSKIQHADRVKMLRKQKK